MPTTSRDNQTLPPMPPPTMTTNLGGTHQPNSMAILPTLIITSSARPHDTRNLISYNGINPTASNQSQPNNALQQTATPGVETDALWTILTAVD